MYKCEVKCSLTCFQVSLDKGKQIKNDVKPKVIANVGTPKTPSRTATPKHKDVQTSVSSVTKVVSTPGSVKKTSTFKKNTANPAQCSSKQVKSRLNTSKQNTPVQVSLKPGTPKADTPKSSTTVSAASSRWVKKVFTPVRSSPASATKTPTVKTNSGQKVLLRNVHN